MADISVGPGISYVMGISLSADISAGAGISGNIPGGGSFILTDDAGANALTDDAAANLLTSN